MRKYTNFWLGLIFNDAGVLRRDGEEAGNSYLSLVLLHVDQQDKLVAERHPQKHYGPKTFQRSRESADSCHAEPPEDNQRALLIE